MKQSYEALKKRFKLPEFEELDFNFEITTIENPEPFLLRNIRRKIMEKVEFFTKFLEDLLQAEPMLPTLYECRFFTDQEKIRVFDTYKHLMKITRDATLLAIDDGEQEDAEFISKINEEWKELQKELRFIAEKAKKGWVKEPASKEDLGYLG